MALALSLLREGPFLVVWLTGLLIATGRWLEVLALSVFVFDRTGSPFMVAFLTLLRLAPLPLFGAVVGAIAERIGGRMILVLSLGVMSVVSLVLVAFVVAERIEIWHLAVGAFLSGIFWTIELTVRRVMLGNVAGGDRVMTAMSFESATANATRFWGPLAGGVIFQMLDLSGVFALSAGIFVLCGILIGRAALPLPMPSVGQRNVLRSIIEGWRYVRSKRVIGGTLVINLVFNIFGFPVIALVPVVGQETFGLAPIAVGMLASSEGLGALLSAFVVALLARREHFHKVYLYSVLVYFLFVLGFSQAEWAALAGGWLFVIGIAGNGYSVMLTTIVLISTDEAVRHRVMGLMSVCIGSGVLGILHVGLLADWIGTQAALALMAIEGLVALLIVYIAWPEIR